MLNGYPSRLHKDARIHAIPNGWRLTRIGKVCKIRNNLRKPLSEEERATMQGPFPYFGPTTQVDSISEFRLDGKYALIGEDGDHFLKYDRMSMTQLICGKANVNNHAHVIEGTKDCSTEWVFHFFRHRNIYHFLSRQGAGRYKLNKEALVQLPLLLPPVDEQHKIAAILSTWDRAIELTEKLIAAKQKRKHALLQQLITGKVRFKESAFEWNRFHLGDLFKERNENGRDDLPLLSITADRGVIPRDEIDRKDTSTESKAKYKRIVPGDIGYNTMRMWQGVSALSELEGIVSPAYTVCKPGSKIDARFASYLFKLPAIVHLFYRYSQGLVSDTWNLKFRHFAQIQVQIPSLDEQQKIANVLLLADRELQLLQRRADHVRDQKKGLMQKLLSGQVRVSLNTENDEGLGSATL